MANPILDNHGRPITYVRLAVTDRCNLRCFYCMPAEGIRYIPRQELLSYEEMLRLVSILAPMGIHKVRITGGEPFVRKDLPNFLRALHAVPGITQLNLTTNGVLTTPHVPLLKELGVKVNLSLDSLDRERFKAMTRRDELPKVLACLDALQAAAVPTKLNAVIMAGHNTDDIVPLAAYGREHPVEVRFIEEMPFNGSGGERSEARAWSHKEILAELKTSFPDISPLAFLPGETARRYSIPGHQAPVGIIAAFSRTFCGSCNRIRITAQGGLKTCLYDQGVMSLRDLMRSGASDAEVEAALRHAIGHRAKDGFEAEADRGDRPVGESMSTIGG